MSVQPEHDSNLKQASIDASQIIMKAVESKAEELAVILEKHSLTPDVLIPHAMVHAILTMANQSLKEGQGSVMFVANDRAFLAAGEVNGLVSESELAVQAHTFLVDEFIKVSGMGKAIEHFEKAQGPSVSTTAMEA